MHYLYVQHAIDPLVALSFYTAEEKLLYFKPYFVKIMPFVCCIFLGLKDKMVLATGGCDLVFCLCGGYLRPIILRPRELIIRNAHQPGDCSVADPDPDSHGSAFKKSSWIRIQEVKKPRKFTSS